MFQWNTNRDLHTPYSTVLFRMTFSELKDLAKYSMTRSVARSLCDSWASCTFCILVALCELDLYTIMWIWIWSKKFCYVLYMISTLAIFHVIVGGNWINCFFDVFCTIYMFIPIAKYGYIFLLAWFISPRPRFSNAIVISVIAVSKRLTVSVRMVSVKPLNGDRGSCSGWTRWPHHRPPVWHW